MAKIFCLLSTSPSSSSFLQLELLVFIYVRSVREENLLLYIDALSKLVPWFFALGHTHYVRWIPVHRRDMLTLDIRHPNVFAQFLAGNFTVKKTTHAFSAIAIDFVLTRPTSRIMHR